MFTDSVDTEILSYFPGGLFSDCDRSPAVFPDPAHELPLILKAPINKRFRSLGGPVPFHAQADPVIRAANNLAHRTEDFRLAQRLARVLPLRAKGIPARSDDFCILN